MVEGDQQQFVALGLSEYNPSRSKEVTIKAETARLQIGTNSPLDHKFMF
jgi:hypothetical protein